MGVTDAAPILHAAGVSKTFRMGESELAILRDLELSVAPGEFVAIEGRSGSGKSTLLHCLSTLDGIDGGSIQFNGQEISKLRSSAKSRLRNTQFGFVFQFYHLLPELNVLENALLSQMIELSRGGFRSRKTELRVHAIALLEQLGMHERLKHRPAQLSGGERQRVALARALMNRPKILFADEPTGNLDVETGGQIMRVLENLHREHRQTIIMVTHDRTIARQADRTLVLAEGKLASAG